MPVTMPYQHVQAQQLQPGYEKLAKRLQSSSPGGSNNGDRFERVASDAKPGREVAMDSSPVTDGLSQILNQPLSQGHMSWSPQVMNFADLPQVHQPPVLQHFKQQLSSLQIPSLQHNSLYARDSGALRLPSPRIQGLVDISASDSTKHELDDQGEGSQFSPGRRRRKQNQRSWGFND
ncbi:hypothetical protein KC19_12G050000 [Ceratodon purpureus]|uniref:Uncharacterized protein n=1 Tax=Ceratodon purpureus TaxID=3225 RepID=A0A8T0G9H2_CERPU|nr:hypothetical protein KC19_12G050000 [Ceratodon purpureus]